MGGVTIFYLSLTLFVYCTTAIFTICRINDGLISKPLSIIYIIIDLMVSIYIIYRFFYIKKMHSVTKCIKYLIMMWNLAYFIVMICLVNSYTENEEKRKFLSQSQLRIFLFYELIATIKFYLHIISFIRTDYCCSNTSNSDNSSKEGCWQEITIKEENEKEQVFNNEKRLKEIKKENNYLKTENQRLIEEKIKIDSNNIRNKKIEILLNYIKSKYSINISKENLIKKLLFEIKDKCGIILDQKKYEEIFIKYVKQNVFEFLKCPLTNKLFDNPYITPDGQTFDKNKIIEEIKKTGINPITDKELKLEKLIKNKLVLDIVEIINNHEDDFNIQHFKEIKQKLISNKTKKLFKNPYIIPYGEYKGITIEANEGFTNLTEYPNLVIKNMIEHNLEIFDDNILKFDIELDDDYISKINSDPIKYNTRNLADKKKF